MFLIFAGVAGLLAALAIHGMAWQVRLNHLLLTVIAGAVSALGLTGFFLLYLTSDIARQVLIVMVILYLLLLGIGLLQARSLRVLWWKGVLALFFEVALAFMTGTAVNLTLQNHIPWFEQQFPGIDVYALINSFLWGLTIPLLVLGVIRPLARLLRSRVERPV